MIKITLLFVTVFCIVFQLSGNTVVDKNKIKEKDEPEKKPQTDTLLSTEDVEELRNSLNILSLYFPNEVFIDSALSVNLRYVEPDEEIERPSKSFYSFTYMEEDTIFFGEQDSKQIENSLDSLVNVWGVKKHLEKKQLDSFPVHAAKEDIPDSIYIERLSKLPSIIELSYNNVVRNFIELYTQKRREQVSMMLGLAEYYFPVFEQALEEYNLPLELRYLPVIESALNPRARSRAGATGLWQFMYYTGKMYGLEINSFVDERCDPIKSSYAAVRFLKDLYDRYQDWTLVIAAYNCGPGNVNKAIRRAGGHRDYWKIYYYLPRETRGYVPAFIGAAYAMNYNKLHGIYTAKPEMPVFNDTIMVNEKLHLMQVASVLDIPIEKIRDMNPQYRCDIIPATGKSYSLKLPEQQALSFIDNQDSIFSYQDSIFFDKRSVVEISSRKSYSRYKYNAPSVKDKAKLYYTVQPGDNLGFICAWYDVRKSDIRYWNNIYRNRIFAGKKLVVYVPKNRVNYYEKINNMTFAEKQKLVGKSVSVNKKQYASNQSSSSNTANGNFVYYKIRRGDNLWTIARKYPGVSNYDIMRLNNLSKHQVQNLKPGDVLKIKRI